MAGSIPLRSPRAFFGAKESLDAWSLQEVLVEEGFREQLPAVRGVLIVSPNHEQLISG